MQSGWLRFLTMQPVRYSGILVGLCLLGISLIAEPGSGQEATQNDLPGMEHTLEVRLNPEATGYAVFPAIFSDGEPREILDPNAFQLHMTDAEKPGEEIIKPAGQLFDPPVGRYRLWLQGEWSMTPYTQLVSFGTRRSPGSPIIRSMPVFPAGLVTVPDGMKKPGLQLRLLSAGNEGADLLRHELSRRIEIGELDSGLLMPAGTVIAATWSPKLDRYVALSPPFEVRGEETTVAPLATPASDESGLVVYVERPDDVPGTYLRNLALRLTQGSRSHRPEATVTTPWGTYAVWRGLEPGEGVLAGGNSRLYLDGRRLTLEGGEIVRFHGDLGKRLFPPTDGGDDIP